MKRASQFAFLVSILLGCQPRWHRTNVSAWVRQPIPAEGFEIEVPEEIAGSVRGERGSRQWRFPPNRHDEDVYIMVFAERTTASQMTKTRLSQPNQDEASIRYSNWENSLHPSISAYGATEYRRDLMLPTGEIIRFQVFYTDFQFTPEQRREDAATIRRMLESARPLH